MAKVSVPIARSSKVAQVENGATVGATLGVNLYRADGSVVAETDLVGTAASSTADGNSGNAFLLWSFLREVPDNVSALENASGTGLFVLTGAGTGALRSLATSADLTLSNANGVAGNPTFGLADLADAGGGALVKLARDAKGRIAGTSAATTSDLAEGSNLYYTDARADARITAQKGAASGLATLDASGKLDAGQLPALAITETFVVASEAAMLALTAQEGDVAVRTDLNQSFILTTNDPTLLANWQELLAPTGTVSSFNGRTGAVVPASGDYTPAQVGAEPAITAGTTVQYWRGDKSWQPVAALIPAGYIDGLQMQWVSGTALTVSSGAAYIEGTGAVLSASAAIAKTGLVLTASTWYHVYLYDNAGTPDVEIVTTAPAAPYNGTARSKTGDSSRRYVGSVKTDASSAMICFLHQGSLVRLLTDLGIQVLGTGSATSNTTVSCSSACPVTAISALMSIDNSPLSGVSVFVGIPSVPRLAAFYTGTVSVYEGALDSSQNLSYHYASAPSSSGTAIRILGYTFGR